MKLNKTEQKVIERLKFYACLGFTQLDRSTGVRMKQAALSLRDKGIITIESHKYEREIWTLRFVKNMEKVKQSDLDKLRELEERASRMIRRLYDLETKWEKQVEKLEKQGWKTDYNWSDVLA